MVIDSISTMERAASACGILPFFRNCVRGLSVQEMAAPGTLFGEDDGCWEWKGPVIRQRTTAYGKFFNRKAGFVSVDLLADFLNYRRHKYAVEVGSVDEMILDIIRVADSLTSTQLKGFIFGSRGGKRNYDDPVDMAYMSPTGKPKSLEGPLQRLQMGGWLLISDFRYKVTRRGERYGWGVAEYSTPEALFPDSDFSLTRSPEESFRFLVESVMSRTGLKKGNEIASLLQ